MHILKINIIFIFITSSTQQQIEMDNNNTQKMDNWKKQVIMDPVLNVLFDPSLSNEDLLNTKILTLPHDEILNVYSRLTALKHLFSKTLQKQVQSKHQILHSAFENAQSYREDFSVANNPKMNEYLNHLKKFNSKYENVNDSVVLWKNTTTVLHFSQALESILVQSRILRTLMRGYDGNQAREQSINPLKISKLILQITTNSMKYDFSGISTYENERVFISSTKSIIHSLTDKNLQNSLNSVYQIEVEKYEGLVNNTIEYLKILRNLGTLREFLTSYFKKILNQISEKLKKAFQQPSNQETETFFKNQLLPTLIRYSTSLLFLEELLIHHKHIESIQNIPNLFSKFWDKLVEYYVQMLGWVRDQENRNPPKSEQNSLYWKYPIIYKYTGILCNNVHEIILKSTQFNSYTFYKSKEKLVFTIVEVSKEYHRRTQQTLKKQVFKEGKQQISEEEVSQRITILKKLVNNCQSQIIFDSLMEKLCVLKSKELVMKVKQVIVDSPFTITLDHLKRFKQ